MDIADYVNENPIRIHALARASRIPILRLKRLVADPAQPVRYMTARRLVAATEGTITMEALGRRGPMRGESTYDGPLGAVIADIASTGLDVASRLAASGISVDHFHETLLRGRVPGGDRVALYAEAFGEAMSVELFRDHAAWRRAA